MLLLIVGAYASRRLKCVMALLELPVHRWFKPNTAVGQGDVRPSKSDH